METKTTDSTRRDERAEVRLSQSGDSEDAAELRIDQTQEAVEELKRTGGVIETHANGTGVITIWLRWPRTGRHPVAGRGHSFPAALSDLVRSVQQS